LGSLRLVSVESADLTILPSLVGHTPFFTCAANARRDESSSRHLRMHCYLVGLWAQVTRNVYQPDMKLEKILSSYKSSDQKLLQLSNIFHGIVWNIILRFNWFPSISLLRHNFPQDASLASCRFSLGVSLRCELVALA